MTGVNKIDEVRKLRFVDGLPIKEIVRRAKLARNTIRKILRNGKTKLEYHRTKQVQPVTGAIRETIAAWLKEDLEKKRKNRRTAWRMYEILRNDDAYKYKG
ncbi:MAG: IS21 family transposase, partial [Candidatus Auribacterota bacterium]|nr:IS21 family transposase [Candidatus Auribacterota bacterium]